MRKEQQLRIRRISGGGIADLGIWYHATMSVVLPDPTERIREEARRLDFFAMGVARAEALPKAGRFEEWLAKKMHGAMAYMERQAEKRRDPSLILADARTVLVLGMNYHTGHPLTQDPLTGKISRYAWGDDYHQVILPRLRRLLKFIQGTNPAARGACYVDTGPVMEKVWGAQTALGWMGKHGNLIARSLGSWFFIGVVLLNIELEYDRPERGYCGTCTRCIPACPTGAIVAPYVVDARHCISYLTIELRGPIPRFLRPLIGNRIFGCDDCQEVCPWSRFARIASETRFRPRAGAHMPELASLAVLSKAEFDRRFRGSAVRRATRDGFVRNVVVALGNSGDHRAIPALAAALGDGSPLVRAHAAWALGRIGGDDAIALLGRAALAERDTAVIDEINLAARSGPGES